MKWNGHRVSQKQKNDLRTECHQPYASRGRLNNRLNKQTSHSNSTEKKKKNLKQTRIETSLVKFVVE